MLQAAAGAYDARRYTRMHAPRRLQEVNKTWSESPFIDAGRDLARACAPPRRLQEVNKTWSESPFIADNVGALSPEARDLLNRIFELDPMKRITVPDIMRHPWCARCLWLPSRTSGHAAHSCCRFTPGIKFLQLHGAMLHAINW